MNSRQQPTKKPKLENINSSPKTDEEISPELIRATRKAREVFIFGKLRELKKNLEKLNYNLLLAARLNLSEEILLDEDLPNRSIIIRPAARYLKSIINEMSAIFSKDEETIFKYLIESLNNKTVQNNAHVVMLADILLNFKLSVEKTGLLSKEAGVFEKAGLSKYLNTHCNWLSYFHTVIKNGFVKMSIDDARQKDFLNLVNKLQSMQDLTYRSLQKNFPDLFLTHKYADLEFKQRHFRNVDPISFFGSHPGCDRTGATQNEPKLELGMKRRR